MWTQICTHTRILKSPVHQWVPLIPGLRDGVSSIPGAIHTCTQTHTHVKIFKINLKNKMHAYTCRSIESHEIKMGTPFSILQHFRISLLFHSCSLLLFCYTFSVSRTVTTRWQGQWLVNWKPMAPPLNYSLTLEYLPMLLSSLFAFTRSFVLGTRVWVIVSFAHHLENRCKDTLGLCWCSVPP